MWQLSAVCIFLNIKTKNMSYFLLSFHQCVLKPAKVLILMAGRQRNCFQCAFLFFYLHTQTTLKNLFCSWIVDCSQLHHETHLRPGWSFTDQDSHVTSEWLIHHRSHIGCTESHTYYFRRQKLHFINLNMPTSGQNCKSGQPWATIHCRHTVKHQRRAGRPRPTSKPKDTWKKKVCWKVDIK